MSARARVLCGVAIRRVVTAQRRATRLTRPEMHPLGADLHTFFAFPALRMCDGRNRFDMGAGFLGHSSLLYSLST